METTTFLFLCYAFIVYFSIRLGYIAKQAIEQHWDEYSPQQRIVATAITIIIPLSLITASLFFLLVVTHN